MSSEELRLARAILEDAAQLSEKAQREGVTAYLKKPLQRERPNERFLRNTIINVNAANKRAEEAEMWARYDAERQKKSSSSKKRKHCHSNDDERDDDHQRSAKARTSPTSSAEHHLPDNDDDDFNMAKLLAGKSTRGRGGIGARASPELGPYLEPTPGEEIFNEDVAIRKISGPIKPPDWVLQKKAARDGSSDDDSGSSDSEERIRRKDKKRKKKDKKHKKDKKKKKKSKKR